MPMAWLDFLTNMGRAISMSMRAGWAEHTVMPLTIQPLLMQDERAQEWAALPIMRRLA